MIDYKELNVFFNNPEPQVLSIMATFENTINEHGLNSFVPMCIYFDAESNVKFAITSRPWSDKDDMYKSFSEMLFAFSALGAESFMFANDVRITKYEPEVPHSKTMEAQDALNIAFVSKESSALVSIPYSIGENNQVKWHLDLSVTSPLSKEDPTEIYQGDMVELFYVMSHIENSPFTTAQLINYYSLKGFRYQIPNGTIVDKIKIKVEDNDNGN